MSELDEAIDRLGEKAIGRVRELEARLAAAEATAKLQNATLMEAEALAAAEKAAKERAERELDEARVQWFALRSYADDLERMADVACGFAFDAGMEITSEKCEDCAVTQTERGRLSFALEDEQAESATLREKLEKARSARARYVNAFEVTEETQALEELDAALSDAKDGTK